MVLLFGELNVADVSKYDFVRNRQRHNRGVGDLQRGKGMAEREKSLLFFAEPPYIPLWLSFFLRLSFSGERKPERRFDEAKSVALTKK